MWLGAWDQFDLKDFTTPSAPLVTSSFPSDEKVSDRTSPECLYKVINSSPVAGFQIFTAPSLPPVTSLLPSGVKAMRLTLSVWPSDKSSRRVSASHSLTVLSCPLVASVAPSGEKAMAMTRSAWPAKIRRRPDSRFCKRTLLFARAVAIHFTSGEKTTRCNNSTSDLIDVPDSLPVATSQNFKVLLSYLKTKCVPSGEKSAAETYSVCGCAARDETCLPLTSQTVTIFPTPPTATNRPRGEKVANSGLLLIPSSVIGTVCLCSSLSDSFKSCIFPSRLIPNASISPLSESVAAR